VYHSSPPAFVLSEFNKKTIIKTSQLAMSTETSTLPEIEVVSQPDTAFLEKKGVCESNHPSPVRFLLGFPIEQVDRVHAA
jgi:hypothetical protein